MDHIMTSTVITALYDIGRDKKGDGRTIDQYLNWFEKTLQLNVPMVVYTEEKFKQFIIDKRKYDTKIVIKPLNEIPYFKYNEKIIEILNNNEYKLKIKDPNRIECNLSLYNIIQYSKFDWIVEAIEQMYFDTEYYFWMDAGCSRFFQDVNPSKEWPLNYNLLCKDKFNIQGNSNNLYYNIADVENYIWDSNCILVGTMFGGSKYVCVDIAERVKSQFELYLNDGIVNNEQIILGYLFKKDPSLFNVFIKLNGEHLPFFKELA
jgi:hypothetical protein